MEDWTEKTIRQHLNSREKFVHYEELLRLTKLLHSDYKVKLRIIPDCNLWKNGEY